VKKAGLHIALLLLAALYCLAMGHVVRADSAGVLQGEHSPSTGSTISGPTGLFLHHTSQTESLVQVVSGPSAAGSKDLSTGFAACVRANDRDVRAAFVRQARASRSLLVAQRRSDLTYPFHTFW
jgi:hypothetical protein